MWERVFLSFKKIFLSLIMATPWINRSFMQSIYRDIQKKAVKIASEFALPLFYKDYYPIYEASRMFFETDPIIAKLKTDVTHHIESDFGHGMNHVVKVTVDSGALLIIEARDMGLSEALIRRLVLITQCAGLLHDIKRKEKEHALKGSIFARDLLKPYPLTEDEIETIGLSIKNHEAFKPFEKIESPNSALVSDCLYDADKFRWGPDNFTETVWDMLMYANTPISRFIDRYPKSIEGLSKIKSTFRTPTGKKYGPQFIDLGIAIGEKIYQHLKKTYSTI